MATLRSEDKEFPSFITIEPGKRLAIKSMSASSGKEEDQHWQFIDLKFGSGERQLAFTTHGESAEKALGEKNAAVENISAVAHAYLLCRQPADEPAHLIKLVEEMLEGKRPKVLFEPAEPVFELSISSVAGGLRVDFFVDAGNVETGIYRWDSLGIRFFTTDSQLGAFLAELKSDFNC